MSKDTATWLYAFLESPAPEVVDGFAPAPARMLSSEPASDTMNPRKTSRSRHWRPLDTPDLDGPPVGRGQTAPESRTDSARDAGEARAVPCMPMVLTMVADPPLPESVHAGCPRHS